MEIYGNFLSLDRLSYVRIIVYYMLCEYGSSYLYILLKGILSSKHLS